MIKACLEDVRFLGQRGCKVKGKWTQSHTGILGNERADALAKEAANDIACGWSRTTLKWLRSRPYHNCMEEWQKRYNLQNKPRKKPFEPTSNLPCRSARAISRLRASLTAIDPNPMKPPAPCGCGAPQNSAKRTLLGCTIHTTAEARARLMRTQTGPATWQNIMEMNIQPREILTCMATTGLLQVRNIIITDDDVREAGYKLGEDI